MSSATLKKKLEDMMEDASVEISEVGGKHNNGDILGSLIDQYIIDRRRS
jgi:hypothetical protein